MGDKNIPLRVVNSRERALIYCCKATYPRTNGNRQSRAVYIQPDIFHIIGYQTRLENSRFSTSF